MRINYILMLSLFCLSIPHGACAQQKNKQIYKKKIPPFLVAKDTLDSVRIRDYKDQVINIIRNRTGSDVEELPIAIEVIDFPQKQLAPQVEESMVKDVNKEFEMAYLEPDESEGLNLDDAFEVTGRFDSRVEINTLTPDDEEQFSILQRTQDLFCIVDSYLLEEVEDNKFELDRSQKLGMRYNLCKSEPYIDQPSICIGTAFRADEDKIITAKHVFDNHQLDEIRLIQMFQVTSDDDQVSRYYNQEQVLKPIEFIGTKELDDLDIALVQVNARSKPKAVLDINYEPNIKDPVYTLGHPVGLPLKLTINASIKSLDQSHLYTSLDTFQGNSGSPVYSRDSHNIIGILLAGGSDFESNGGCQISHLCVGPNCGREKVLNIKYLWPYLEEYLND